MIVYINVGDELKYYRSQRNTAVIAFEIFTRYLPFPIYVCIHHVYNRHVYTCIYVCVIYTHQNTHTYIWTLSPLQSCRVSCNCNRSSCN